MRPAGAGAWSWALASFQFHSTIPYSLSNPFVHSLSVTLGNHAIPPSQPYNCPCPTGHLQKGIWPCDLSRGNTFQEPSFAFTPGAGVRTLMAFGFGFNKQKVLSAAEKYVQQGKMQNAIAENEKVLKNDPKDLTVTTTVGDLYSPLAEFATATDSFKVFDDAYAT